MKRMLRILAAVVVVAGCASDGDKEAASTTTASTIRQINQGVPAPSPAVRQEAAQVAKQVEALFTGLPTGLMGTRTGSSNQAEVAGQWRLAADDIVTAVRPLRDPAVERAASALRSALSAVADCIRSVNPDFYVATVEGFCASLTDQVTERSRLLGVALGQH